jgi:hypothetical protein
LSGLRISAIIPSQFGDGGQFGKFQHSDPRMEMYPSNVMRIRPMQSYVHFTNSSRHLTSPEQHEAYLLYSKSSFFPQAAGVFYESEPSFWNSAGDFTSAFST